MIIFLLLIVLILVLVHFFILYFVLFSFWIQYKLIYYFITFLLSISFLLSSISTHFFHNIFSRSFYFSSSFLLWIISNLFFFLLIVLFFYFILKFFNTNLNLKIFTLLAILWAIFLSFYWFYISRNPIINNITVKINKLPESWKNKKIIQISDVHIWAINWEKFLNKIVFKINSLDPDIIFITWDLFDWTDWNIENIQNYLNKLKAKDWIYFIYWNHEQYLWNEISKEILSKTNIKILDDEVIILDWVQIIWLDYIDEFRWKNDITEKLNKIKINKNIPSILLYHAPMFIENFEKMWIDLQLSWHTHKWQIWPYWVITNKIFKEKDYWLFTNWNYNLYTSNWVWTWWPPMRIWNKPEIVILNLK